MVSIRTIRFTHGHFGKKKTTVNLRACCFMMWHNLRGRNRAQWIRLCNCHFDGYTYYSLVELCSITSLEVHMCWWMYENNLHNLFAPPPPKVLLLCCSWGACVPCRPQRLCQLEFWLLVGSTMLDRLWARGQTKSNTPLMLATSVSEQI